MPDSARRCALFELDIADPPFGLPLMDAPGQMTSLERTTLFFSAGSSAFTGKGGANPVSSNLLPHRRGVSAA
jgi:hypothetical protein